MLNDYVQVKTLPKLFLEWVSSKEAYVTFWGSVGLGDFCNSSLLYLPIFDVHFHSQQFFSNIVTIRFNGEL